MLPYLVLTGWEKAVPAHHAADADGDSGELFDLLILFRCPYGTIHDIPLPVQAIGRIPLKGLKGIYPNRTGASTIENGKEQRSEIIPVESS